MRLEANDPGRDGFDVFFYGQRVWALSADEEQGEAEIYLLDSEGRYLVPRGDGDARDWHPLTTVVHGHVEIRPGGWKSARAG